MHLRPRFKRFCARAAGLAWAAAWVFATGCHSTSSTAGRDGLRPNETRLENRGGTVDSRRDVARAPLARPASSRHARELHRFEFQQPHMGTLFRLLLYAPEAASARAAANAAFARVAALEQMMSDYDPESELMQLCRNPAGEPVRVSDALFDVLHRSLRVARISDGAFDPTVGPLIRLWRRARRIETLPPPELLARARETVGYQKLKLDTRRRTVTLTVPHMQLDLGGIGKGYAADQALAVLKQRGVPRALVAASGDIAVGDPPPGRRGWRVSIGAPEGGLARSGSSVNSPSEGSAGRPYPSGAEPGRDAPILDPLLLKNAAVSTSGDTEQFVEIDGRRYSHIVDPRTGVGLTERLQVTIVAGDAATTDSFATAVSVLGVERGLALVESQPNLAAVILRKDGERLETFASRRFKKLPRAGAENLAR